MDKSNRYWVNDETRYCRVTYDEASEAAAELHGFREVTGEEWDTFRAETRTKFRGLFSRKGSR